MTDTPKHLLAMMEADSKPQQMEMFEEFKVLGDNAEATFDDFHDRRQEPLAPLVIRDYPVKGTPKDHQHRALNESYSNAGHCWWVDPGGGKTFLTIADAALAYERNVITGVLILAPNGPHEQWIEEQFPEWADVRWEGVHNKMTPGQINAWFKYRHRGLAAAAINYEALATVKGQQFMNNFIDKYPQFMLAVDESQKCKNPKAKRTQEMMLLALQSRMRRFLSGTPLLKGLEDLWTQYEAAQRGITGDFELYRPKKRGGRGIVKEGFFAYRANYCHLKDVRTKEQKQQGVTERTAIVGYKNQEALMKRVRPIATRIMADEFMKGEAPDFMAVRTPMTDSQKRTYKQMEKHLVAQLTEGTITAQNALVQMGKLQQIAAGFMYGDNPDEYEVHEISNSKVDAVTNIIEQLAEPVIVWSHFAHIQMSVRTAAYNLGKTVYDKSTVEEWKKDPEGVLVGNQTSGLGVGMNLQHAAANIYATNSFSSEARWQSLKRTDRMGQTRQVRNWDLITPGTVEETVMTSLREKEDISRMNIDQLREMMI